MLKGILKVMLSVIIFTGIFMIGVLESFAADVTIQDDSFSLAGGAVRVSDTSSSDGYSSKMLNNSGAWNIQYNQRDYSSMKCGVSYDVYFRVKVKHAVTNPTGTAFKIGVYDSTYGDYVLGEKAIAASDTNDMEWHEYKIGTFKPNSGVNHILCYIAGTDNASQVSEIYADYLIFKEYTPYTIEDSGFILYNDSSLVADGLADDDSAAVVVNGSGGNWNVQVPIDATKIEAGVSYDIIAIVKPIRSNWYTSSGDMFACLLYDETTGTNVISPTVYNSSTSPTDKKVQWYYGIILNSSGIQLNPTHSYKVVFYQVNNAANFPSYRVDRVYVKKTNADDNPIQSISASPYKISPANADGYNDTMTITYTLPGTRTISARVYDSGNTLVGTLVNSQQQSGTVTIYWDGKNGSGQVVPNGIYTIKINDGNSDIIKKDVEIITGVTIPTPATNVAKDYFPKGVWFEGGYIPFNSTDAGIYLDASFSDIYNAGMNTVMIINQHYKPYDVYVTTLDKAGQNGLKVIAGIPEIINIWGNPVVFNDEAALYNALNDSISGIKNHSALYGYLLADEPLYYDSAMRNNLKGMKGILETIDPNHPVFVDFNEPLSLEWYSDTLNTQVVLTDPYGAAWGRPVGDFLNYMGNPTLSFESALDFYNLKTRARIDYEAPNWNILQAFTGYPEGFRDPTPEEMRVMTYEAIGRGSKGYFYFMYQQEEAWDGMVDAYYNHTSKYGTVQTLLNEITSMESTIRNMRKISNFATTSGGGGGSGAYANGDITSHVNYTTGDKYLVVTNHDVVNPQNITITINRAQLGMDITAVKNVLDNTAISYTTDGTNYTITNLNFAAGGAKIIQLVKANTQVVYTGQDTSFAVANGASVNNTDVSASDSKSAVKVLQATNGWDIQWAWDKTQLVPGAQYDLYAVVKIKYTVDMALDSYGHIYFPVPAGNAFSMGVYDVTTSSFVINDFSTAAASMDNMLWQTIKVGTFIPSQTNNQYVYLSPSNYNTANVDAVYVDRFYFIKK